LRKTMWPYVMGELAETNANLRSTPTKIREDHKGHVIVAQHSSSKRIIRILDHTFFQASAMCVRMVHAQTSSELC